MVKSNTIHLRVTESPLAAPHRRGALMTGFGLWRTYPRSVGIRPTQERAICESVLAPGQLRRKG
jgi:hypothetical protein